MTTNDRIQGFWWLSDNPNNQVPGDLLISKRKLELNGSFEGIRTGLYGGEPKIIGTQDKAILGVSKKGGKKYTLEFFDEPSFSMSFSGYKADTYRLGTIFEGHHFTKIRFLLFQKYYVDFPYLFEWVGDSVISAQMRLQNQKKYPIDDITIKIGSPKTIDVFENAQFKLSFVLSAHKVPLGFVKNINISQQCLVKIEPKEANLNLTDFYSIVSHLERFLMIAIGKSLQPIRFQGVLIKGEKSSTVDILPPFPKQKQYDEIHSLDMNLTFSDIRSDSQIIFDKWFSNKDKHIDTFDLFSAINTDLNKNINNQFKDIISAMEGYARIEKENFDMQLDQVIRTLNEEIPEANRPLQMGDYIRIRITRNKLSHVTVKSENEKFILNNDEKLIYFYKLIFILEYCFLKNLRMSAELLDKFYEKRKRWLSISSQKR